MPVKFLGYAIDPRVIIRNPRFNDDTPGVAASYFDDLAERYGRDETGIAWMAACLAYDQLGIGA